MVKTILVKEVEKPSLPPYLVPAFEIQKTAAGTNGCKAGGSTIKIFIDDEPKNKVLDREETILGETILCNGERGANGTSGGGSSASSPFPVSFESLEMIGNQRLLILKTGNEVLSSATALQNASDILVDKIPELTKRASVLRCRAKLKTNDLYFPANYNIIFSINLVYRNNGETIEAELPWVSQTFTSLELGIYEGLISLPENWTDYNNIQSSVSVERPEAFCTTRVVGPNGALLFESVYRGSRVKANLKK